MQEKLSFKLMHHRKNTEAVMLVHDIKIQTCYQI